MKGQSFITNKSYTLRVSGSLEDGGGEKTFSRYI